MTAAEDTSNRVTSRRMLALRARLHEARIWRQRVICHISAAQAAVNKARGMLAASESFGYDEVAAIDRASVGRLVRMLDAWREELDAVDESERRITTTIENATFAQGLAAARQEARDAT